jgi:ribosome-binding protein aMBF1 (putative translation factor)
MTGSNDPEAIFLEQLGQRVRTMRGLRGMSRKVLAKVSGLSERYIAQLESGKGNVSIVLLRLGVERGGDTSGRPDSFQPANVRLGGAA